MVAARVAARDAAFGVDVAEADGFTPAAASWAASDRGGFEAGIRDGGAARGAAGAGRRGGSGMMLLPSLLIHQVADAESSSA